MKTKLSNCPICGSKAYLKRDIVDGFDYGWSVGCPRASVGDGVHGFNDRHSFHEAHLVFNVISSKERAIKIWNARCKWNMKKGGRS